MYFQRTGLEEVLEMGAVLEAALCSERYILRCKNVLMTSYINF